MTTNLLYAVPALAAVTAYANAKLRLSVDYKFLGSWILHARTASQQEKLGKASLFCRLEEHVADPQTCDEVFLIYDDKTWTFKQFYDNALRYAAWLQQTHHVQPQEVVALDFMNCAEFLFLILACWSVGAVPALLNYNLVGQSLVHCVKVSTSRLLIVDHEVADKALTEEVRHALGEGVSTVVLTSALQTSVAEFSPYRAPDSARAVQDDREPGLLVYTSGTTGNPKAAVMPHPRLNFAAGFAARFLDLKSVKQSRPDRFHTSMPLYHATAFNLGFMPCLYSATTIVISRKFSVGNFWPEVKKHNVTIIQYVGETLRYLLATTPKPAEDKNHKIRMAFGNGLRADVWKAFKVRFGIDTIVELYGASEGFAAKLNMNRNEFSDGAISAYGTVATMMSHFKEAIVKIDWETEQPWRDPKTGLCKRADYNEAGELMYKVDAQDPTIQFRGYLGNPEASQKKIIRDVLVKGDAYFRSGDAVKIDREGRTYFSDRIGDTYRWRSENVSTNEVGGVLGYHNAVIEANVYGVTVPGHEGRAGCAALLLQDDALKDGNRGVIVKEDILKSLAEHATKSLPKYAVPQFLRVVQESSVTGNNKQQKTGLRKQGIELREIREAGSSDRMYWLKPGVREYSEFSEQDLDALKSGTTRL